MSIIIFGEDNFSCDSQHFLKINNMQWVWCCTNSYLYIITFCIIGFELSFGTEELRQRKRWRILLICLIISNQVNIHKQPRKREDNSLFAPSSGVLCGLCTMPQVSAVWPQVTAGEQPSWISVALWSHAGLSFLDCFKQIAFLGFLQLRSSNALRRYINFFCTTSHEIEFSGFPRPLVMELWN